jgi:tetratricopeptide (TPR) repeat protein
MGRVYESIGKQDEAAAAYQQALIMAPDYQEANFALLSMGYKPVGSHPTDEDLERAQLWDEQHPLPVAGQSPASDETPTSETLMTEATAQDIESIFGDAARTRMPTPEEIHSTLFTAKGESSELPSALSPDFPSEQDIILGTYPYHFRKAEQMRRKHQYEEAASEYQNAMQADPTQSEARLALGDMMMKLESYPQARFQYERAIEDFPQQPKPYLKMGNYYLATKQPETAREYYHKAIEHDPQYSEAINNMAVLSMQEKDYVNASALLDKLIEMDPTYANAYLNRGIIASDIDKDNKAALEYFKEYVNLGGERSVQARQWIQDLEAGNR